MISKFFIERPVLSNVIAILMMLIGGVALFNLPVAQYPDVVPPTVQVTTRYPGAGAKTVIDTVALPIEQQVNGVEDMLYMQSYSGADGAYTLTVTFKIGTDLNFAQVLVQNRVSSALSALPQAVQNQGVTVQKKSTAVLLFVTLTSPNATYDSLFLSNYATINIRDELSRLPGVGNVSVFGAGQYSMRIWLDPDKLQTRALVPQDVIQAIQQQNEQVAAGQLGMPPTPAGQSFQYTLNISGRLDDPREFEDVIVKIGNNGDLTRVRDVGRVELGAQTYSQMFSLNNQQATGIGVFQSPGANALEVERATKQKMAALAASFPKDMKYDIPFDTTKFVSASIAEVYKTLIEAGLLVLVVILVFLQDWRAMLVPTTTVPVTIIGAFAGMAALRFTVNLSTLFAIVLAIGIVVDDAIVVVEAAVHNIERGMNGHDAAISAMDALFAPIVGITLVLVAVFLPAAFLPGMTGRIYAQFALVIAATALLSAVNAATLKPTQCALWLRPPVPLDRRNWFYRGFNSVYARLENAYSRLIGRMVAHSGLSVVVALILIGVGGYGLSRVPTGFIPIEDQGYLLAVVQLPDGASLDRTQRVLKQVGEISAKNSAVDQVITIAGVSALDNSSKFGQRWNCVFDLEGLERPGRRRGFALAGLWAHPETGVHTGGARPRAPAAADTGHRQCRRLCDAARIARRQLRFRETAGDHKHGGRQCPDAERVAACELAVPCDGAAVRYRGRQGQDPDDACHDRPGILGAGLVCRLFLCQSVQQVRPHIPGLCPGGCTIPFDATGFGKNDGAQPARRHDSAGNACDHYPGRRTLAHQPL